MSIQDDELSALLNSKVDDDEEDNNEQEYVDEEEDNNEQEYVDDDLDINLDGDNELYKDEDDNYITLTSSDGEEIEFIEIAGIAYNDNFYAILQPVELLDGMDDNEALVFKVSKNRDGTDNFEVEVDDDVTEHVFQIYYDLLDAEEKKKY